MSKAVQESGSSRGAGPDSNDRSQTESTESDTLDRDDVFEVLSNTRRRHVIHYLGQRDEPVELRPLSKQVAAWENDVLVEEVSAQQRKRVYTALHQSHLPKLDEKGVVSYDSDGGAVRATDRLSDLRLYLEVVPAHEIPWSVYYTGLGLLGTATSTLVFLDVVPVAPPVGGLVGVVFGLLLFASGLYHVLSSRRNRLGTDGQPPEL